MHSCNEALIGTQAVATRKLVVRVAAVVCLVALDEAVPVAASWTRMLVVAIAGGQQSAASSCRKVSSSAAAEHSSLFTRQVIEMTARACRTKVLHTCSGCSCLRVNSTQHEQCQHH